MRQPSADDSSAMDAASLAHTAAELALSKKAEDVMILDLTRISSVCDYFVICHGESTVQVMAIVDAVEDGLEDAGVRVWHVEGRAGRRWVLLDYVDVVIHVFLREAREYYRLEDLWGDVPRETLT